MRRRASVTWKGAIKSGRGSICTESGALDHISYSFSKRFEGEIGTNPEELVAAAHASCFSMALAAELDKMNMEAEDIATSATISFEKTAEGWRITSSHIEVEAMIPGIDEPGFQKIAETVKINCPISQLLNTKITLNAKLIDKERTMNPSAIPREIQQWNG